ncbi:MAG: hypothetical protein Q4G03_05035 [Planctomycetia bacterium]|nr:hypothetical protein [Planctomycetia bacterium]
MTELFTENYLAWIAIAAVCVLIGHAVFTGTSKRVFFFAGFGACVLALAIGAYLVFFLQTDSKLVRKTIYDLADAVEHNDVERVVEMVSATATRTRRIARVQMALADVEHTKVTDLHVDEINRLTSPPRARVHFRASASGKATGIDSYPFTVLIEFTAVELRLEPDGHWRVTDNCSFNYPGYSTTGDGY